MREITLERSLDPANPLEAVLLANPGLTLTTVSSVISGGKQTTVILFQGDEAGLSNLRRDYIERPPGNIEVAEVLREGKRELLLYEVERSGENPTDISVWVAEILGPETIVRIHKSSEVVRWRILTFRQDRIPTFLERLEHVGKRLETVLMRPVSWYSLAGIAGVRDLTEDRINLSPTEEDVLRAAVRLGYFEIPKKANIRDVAKSVGRPHSTTHHILKRAQAKLLKFGSEWVVE